MSNFDKYTNYNDTAGVTSVVFGADAPVLEVELNEMQEIQRSFFGNALKNLIGDGISDKKAITYSGSILSIGDCFISVDGYLVHCNGLLIPVKNGVTTTVYLQVWEEIVDHTSVLKSLGNQQSSVTVPNYIKDSRFPVETTRRKVVKYTLATSTDSTKHNIAIAETSGGSFTILIREVNLSKLSDKIHSDFGFAGGYGAKVITKINPIEFIFRDALENIEFSKTFRQPPVTLTVVCDVGINTELIPLEVVVKETLGNETDISDGADIFDVLIVDSYEETWLKYGVSKKFTLHCIDSRGTLDVLDGRAGIYIIFNGASFYEGGAVGCEAQSGTGGAVGYQASTTDSSDVITRDIEATVLSVSKSQMVVSFDIIPSNVSEAKLYDVRFMWAGGGDYHSSSLGIDCEDVVKNGVNHHHYTVTMHSMLVDFTKKELSHLEAKFVKVSGGSGGALGASAKVGYGGAVGYQARVGYEEGEHFFGGDGGAVGNEASALDGFAGGNKAKATVKGAVQLGEGINETENTLQFRSTQIVNSKGKIVSGNLDKEFYTKSEVDSFIEEHFDLVDITDNFIESSQSCVTKITHLIHRSGKVISGVISIEGSFDSNTSLIFKLKSIYIPSTTYAYFTGIGETEDGQFYTVAITFMSNMVYVNTFGKTLRNLTITGFTYLCG